MRPNEVWICPDTVIGPPGICTWLSTALVVGSFEEEKEGISTASDVVKVEGEDLATPGCLMGDMTRCAFHGYVLLDLPLSKPRDRI